MPIAKSIVTLFVVFSMLITFGIMVTYEGINLMFLFFIPSATLFIYLIINHRLHILLQFLIVYVVSFVLLMIFGKLFNPIQLTEISFYLALISTFIYLNMYVLLFEFHRIKQALFFFVPPIVITILGSMKIKEWWTILFLLPLVIFFIRKKYSTN